MRNSPSFRSKNEFGFSLIELMIVVAIIGTLASIAVPNYRAYVNKARATQAKNCISGFYQAQKIFHSEWLIYFGNWNNVGFRMEGDVHYRCGFWGGAGGGGPALPAGYTGPGQQVGTSTNQVNTNPAAGNCTGPPSPCLEIATSICGLNVSHVYSSDTFVIAACGLEQSPQGTVASAWWSISENKKMRNTMVP